MAALDNRPNKRQQDRKSVKLRVDAKKLERKELDSILQGDGYPDLSQPSMARRTPREGMESVSSGDLSLGGMRLDGRLEIEPGSTMVVDLHLPGDPVVLKALAEVMWVRGGEQGPKAGLRFAAIGWKELNRLKNTLGETDN